MKIKKILILIGLGLFMPIGTGHISANVPTTGEWEKLEVVATAYCPCKICCGEFADGVTAIGRNAYLKGVAVDRRIIPLRSLVRVPDYGVVQADDVGGAIKNNRIDVRFKTHQEALIWGRKTITVLYQSH